MQNAIAIKRVMGGKKGGNRAKITVQEGTKSQLTHKPFYQLIQWSTSGLKGAHSAFESQYQRCSYWALQANTEVHSYHLKTSWQPQGTSKGSVGPTILEKRRIQYQTQSLKQGVMFKLVLIFFFLCTTMTSTYSHLTLKCYRRRFYLPLPVGFWLKQILDLIFLMQVLLFLLVQRQLETNVWGGKSVAIMYY